MRRHRLKKTGALIGLTAGCLLLGMASIGDAALVAHWMLDDGQTDPNTLTAADSVEPFAHGAWAQGGTELGPIPRWGGGILGGAAEFGGQGGTGAGTAGPGTGDVITIPGEGKLDITGALSLAAWIRYEELGGGISTRHIAGKDRAGGVGQDAYSLKHNMLASADTIQFMISSAEVTGTNLNLTSSMLLSDYTAASQRGGWIHVAGVFEPGQFMRLYVDGVLDAELTTGIPAAIDSFPGTPFNIGRLHNSTTHSFNGGIDDVRIYNEALTQQQIAELIPGPAVPGDFDGDGDVDGADFVVWQTNFPTASGAMLDDGDADGDGDVDGADFVVWQTNFPFTPSPGVATVPEPAAWMLALLALGSLGMVRRIP